jgi:hypothetical protein
MATILKLEYLESREVPAYLTGWRPLLFVQNGTQAQDVIQGRANTCSILASLASLASKRDDDLADRITYLGKYIYQVELYRNGASQLINVRFNGYTTIYDPTCKGTEFWPLLFQRAYLKLTPSALRDGDSLFRTTANVTGEIPVEDEFAAKDEVFKALGESRVVVTQNVNHAFSVLRADNRYLYLYNPWGSVLRIGWGSFYRNFQGIVFDPA